MLPDVDAQQRRPAVHDGRVLVRRRHDFKRASIARDQPTPPRAETTHRRCGELLLKVREAAECRIDRSRQCAAWCTRSTRGHDAPEEVVIDEAAAVVAHGTADGVGKRRQVRDKLFRGHAVQLRVSGEGRVQVGGIGGVVPAVMDFHRAGIDVRLECIVRISQIGKLEGVGHLCVLLRVITLLAACM